MPMLAAIHFAYDVLSDDVILGAPAWVVTERYDVNAKDPNASTPVADLRLMVQSLLRERLAFSAHAEQREQPVYALTVANTAGQLGPRLLHATVDCNARRAAIAAGQTPMLTPPTAGSSMPPCIVITRAESVESGGTPMPMLARILTGFVGRAVVDHTGLLGDYQFKLEFAPNVGADPTSTPSSLPSIFTALQEQLGLKLESTKGSVDVLVVDHIERPTPD
jgi:uncharacterized protein (TIGR03435 family)